MRPFSKLIVPVVILAAVAVAAVVLVLVLGQFWEREPLPEVKSCIGLIAQINQASFNIKAGANKNYGEEDMDIVIKVDEATQYSRLTLPSIVPIDIEDISSLMKEEAIQFSDLRVGDEVVITSQDDIRGKAIFTAATVQVTAGDIEAPEVDAEAGPESSRIME